MGASYRHKLCFALRHLLPFERESLESHPDQDMSGLVDINAGMAPDISGSPDGGCALRVSAQSGLPRATRGVAVVGSFTRVTGARLSHQWRLTPGTDRPMAVHLSGRHYFFLLPVNPDS